MNRKSLWSLPTALAVLASSSPAQQWSETELEQNARGFLEPGSTSRLEQMAELVSARADASPAIAVRIHGDHREYLLKIERLIGRLTDQRWVERETAERTLIEVGAKARSLLEEHRRTGELLEERLRCDRILRRIDARGTEREEQEIQILRGLVATAPYLDTTEALKNALLSALGHTDAEVRRGAIYALGVHGEGADAKSLLPMMTEGAALRRAAVASIVRMKGSDALSIASGWLTDDSFTRTEKLAVLRSLRRRDDAAQILRQATTNPDPVLAAAAAIEMPAEGAPQSAVVRFTDKTEHSLAFRGLTADAIVMDSPVEGLGHLEIPFSECGALEFREAKPVLTEGTCRVFLKQGSLLHGRLKGLAEDRVEIESDVFGTVKLPRAEVQGIALDPELDRLIGASIQEDRVRLRDRSLVAGKVVRLTADEAVLETPEGRRTIPATEIAGILFQRPNQAPQETELFTRVDLASGDRILGNLAGIHSSALGIVAPQLGSAVVPIQDVARLELDVAGGALWGFTLIADYSDNKIVEVDEQGNVVFVLDEVYGAWDVECLDSGNLLITEFSVSRVQEVTRSGEVVWAYEELRNPYDADRLPNGNTLIADTFAGKVIEVTPDGQIAWEFSDGVRPFDADRLPNGNTLIADVLKDRVIEIDPDGKIVWEHKNTPSVHDADRLPNGNTLITLRTLNRVIEVDPNGQEVFRLSDLNAPSDADRLPNGNTIVAENDMAREFDRQGNLVWKRKMTWAVEVNRY